MRGQPDPHWIPIADFQAGRENLPCPISSQHGDVIDPHAALLVVLDFSLRSEDNVCSDVGYAFSTRPFGPDLPILSYDMAPFVSLCHFIDFADYLRHTPRLFLEHDWSDSED